ncbi:MAG: ComEC/Rec2 family competence protein [Thermoanaerobaculia bacterium]
MLVLEALRAKFGDALLLHFGTRAKPLLAVIDGGPPGVWADALEPRLQEIRVQRRLADGKALEIELAMVSHIDRDHIAGMLEMAQGMKELRDARQPLPWKIKRFWHNSFDDLLGNDDVTVGASASGMSAASLGGLLRPEGSLILASVSEGRDLRNLLDALKLEGNPPFEGLVRAGQKPVVLDNLELKVVAPSEKNLLALQKDWDRHVREILEKEDEESRAEAAAFVDRSVYNLSSIVILAEADGKRILLTGDGRGDHTLEGLEAAGLMDAEGRIEVDVLKMPHHGSERNVDATYFDRIRAKHYVISADGKFDNPDVKTLAMISAARPDDRFTIHLTYPPEKFNEPAIGRKVARFFKKEQAAGREYKVMTRKPDELSVSIKLS